MVVFKLRMRCWSIKIPKGKRPKFSINKWKIFVWKVAGRLQHFDEVRTFYTFSLLSSGDSFVRITDGITMSWTVLTRFQLYGIIDLRYMLHEFMRI
jgi:hypothetical protein